ncbi:MAG TPA: hypothetical protein VNH11_19235 [Pirellulales bacterium]|nr:hypothetical protein [Pirellulales bacterium]
MCDLIVSVPDARLAALNVPPEQADDEARMLAAVKLYEMNARLRRCNVRHHRGRVRAGDAACSN